MAMEQGRVTEFKGKSLDQIQIEPEGRAVEILSQTDGLKETSSGEPSTIHPDAPHGSGSAPSERSLRERWGVVLVAQERWGVVLVAQGEMGGCSSRSGRDGGCSSRSGEMGGCSSLVAQERWGVVLVAQRSLRMERWGVVLVAQGEMGVVLVAQERWGLF
uniref:Uncharacterized protein n=1 Tax=Knipowitschia caucasica TaxID=637954 RepID=A0AAV2L2M9_KNICA